MTTGNKRVAKQRLQLRVGLWCRVGVMASVVLWGAELRAGDSAAAAPTTTAATEANAAPADTAAQDAKTQDAAAQDAAGAAEPLNFQTHILPLLRQNCLACHSQSSAEGGVILESLTQIQQGAESGPLMEVGKGEASRIYRVAAHLDEPVMPPEDNKVGAKKFTAAELELLARWIDQGAAAGENAVQAITWQAVPQSIQPVYSVALDRTATWAAGSHGNRASVYSLLDGSRLTELIDPAVAQQLGAQAAPAADLDFIQDLAFSPNGEWLAMSGFRTVKLWRRELPRFESWATGDGPRVTSRAQSRDGNTVWLGFADGSVERLTLATEGAVQRTRVRERDGREVSALAASPEGQLLLALQHGSAFQVVTAEGLQPVFVASRRGSVQHLAWVDGQHLAGIGPTAELTWWNLRAANGTWVLSDHEVAQSALPAAPRALIPGPATSVWVGLADGQIQAWEWGAAQPARSLNHGVELAGLALSADQQRLLSWATQGPGKSWNLADGQAVTLAKDSQRKLTAQQAALEAEVAAQRLKNEQADLEEVQKQLADADTNRKKAVEDRDKSQQEVTAKVAEIEKLQGELAQLQMQQQQQEQGVAAAQQQQEAKTQQLAQLAQAAAELEQRRQQLPMPPAPADDPRQRLLEETRGKLTQLAELAPQEATLGLLQRELDRLQANFQADLQQKLAAIDAVAAEIKAAADRQQQATADRDQGQQSLDKLRADLEALKPQLEAKQKAIDEGQKQKVELDKKLELAAQEIERTEKLYASTQERIPAATQRVTDHQQALAAAQTAQQTAETQREQAAGDCWALSSWGPDRIVGIVATPEGWHLSVWQAATGEPLVQWAGAAVASAPAGAAANSSSLVMFGGRAVIAGRAGLGTLAVHPTWQLAQTWGSPTGDSPFADRVTSLDFSPDSTLLAVGGGEPSRSGQLQIWNVAEGKLVRDFPDAHSDTVLTVAFSPDGKLLASGGTDRFARVFRCEDGALQNTFEGHTHHVLAVAWQLNGRRLVTGSADKTIKVWDAVRGEQVKTIEGFGMDVTGIRWVGASNQFVAGCGDKSLSLCDTDGKRNVIRQLDDYVYTTDLSPTADSVIAGAHSGTIVVFGTDGKDRWQLAPR